MLPLKILNIDFLVQGKVSTVNTPGNKRGVRISEGIFHFQEEKWCSDEQGAFIRK